jgi:hypothetical protein
LRFPNIAPKLYVVYFAPDREAGEKKAVLVWVGTSKAEARRIRARFMRYGTGCRATVIHYGKVSPR